jgi:Domain of unknown function (DUF4365)
MPLPREHLLDELATAYIQAVAAAGGATIAISRRDYGVDGTLNPVVRVRRSGSLGDKFIPEGFSVEFQLKGTTGATVGRDYVAYDLNVRNYDLIVGRSPMATALYLFLVCFGPDMNDWIAMEQEQLILRASAYWWTQSAASTENTSTARVHIPVGNRLTSRSVEDMLEASKNRFAPQ